MGRSVFKNNMPDGKASDNKMPQNMSDGANFRHKIPVLGTVQQFFHVFNVGRFERIQNNRDFPLSLYNVIKCHARKV